MIDELKIKWLENKLPGLDLIIFESGAVQHIDIDFIENNSLLHSFKKEYSISYGKTSTFSEIISKHDEIWSEIQINNRLLVNEKNIFLCGEGEMGNEGFIVKTDINNNIKIIIYSTTSNPFIEIIKINNSLYFKSTSNFYVVIDLISENITICNEDIFDKNSTNKLIF
ncbi:hypothetical protein [Pectobacterium parmentieri]|uniref:Uncharacterized protein n=1 Tax=Pectobacterium parmentieri TaxID=1905730 RepID=A0A8B3FLV3_PECPM|nr:hypothetical protein [Pectobacterium parmentieri]AOR60782.1 hypothetical protein A8F97_18085 [Pectobacterium parmentieri]AYH08286.1 hypothetical protein C5E24_00275 [Pectobacterium parmentieri]AYH17029.1 hypothetical protein C5E22_00275 [Pectobacterium parmentieri]AYH34633.1 hypothetical protein C5E17_00275 [Pectobacterium parmentieri]AZS54718.1 hypothetical protein C5E18_00275 [Pectobacterium parmentieri]